MLQCSAEPRPTGPPKIEDEDEFEDEDEDEEVKRQTASGERQTVNAKTVNVER